LKCISFFLFLSLPWLLLFYSDLSLAFFSCFLFFHRYTFLILIFFYFKLKFVFSSFFHFTQLNFF
jgi:hypothetical protein